MSERLLTARDLGELLGLSPATILDRFEAGDLPGFSLFGVKGGPVRFRLSEIEAALEQWRPGNRQVALTLQAPSTSLPVVKQTRRRDDGEEASS